MNTGNEFLEVYGLQGQKKNERLFVRLDESGRVFTVIEVVLLAYDFVEVDKTYPVSSRRYSHPKARGGRIFTGDEAYTLTWSPLATLTLLEWLDHEVEEGEDFAI